MKKKLLPLMLFVMAGLIVLSASADCSGGVYTDYVGAGHDTDVTVTQCSEDDPANGVKTIDGSGLSGGNHDTVWSNGWLSIDTAANPNPARGTGQWIRYDLGHVYALGLLHVWNSNETGYTTRGLNSVTIDYSEDDTNWTELGTFTFQQAPGSSYPGFDGPDFGGVCARYVILTANSNFGGDMYGLAEVQFNLDTSSDNDPPTPNPMTWFSLPNANYLDISMTATTATDPSGVEYYFMETSSNPGGDDSGWQDSPSYTDTGLNELTQYCYEVQARDKSPNQNLTGWSTNECATSEQAPPALYSLKTEMANQTTADPAALGIIRLDPPGGVYDPDTVVTVTAAPSMLSTFDAWGGDLGGSTNPTTITMDGDKSITASFSRSVPQNKVALDVIIDGPGSGSVTLDPPGGIYDYSAQVTLTAQPSGGSVFSHWGGGNVDCPVYGTDPSMTLNLVDINAYVVAYFDTAESTSSFNAQGNTSEYSRPLPYEASEVFVRFDQLNAHMAFNAPGFNCMMVPHQTDNKLIAQYNGMVETSDYDTSEEGGFETTMDGASTWTRIWIESENDARIVVHFRAAPLSPSGLLAHTQYGQVVSYGLGDHVDEWFTIYPDGTFTREVKVWSPIAAQAVPYTDDRIDTFYFETMEFLFSNVSMEGERYMVDDVYVDALTLVQLDGTYQVFGYDPYPVTGHEWEELRMAFTPFENAPMAIINTKSQLRPFTIGREMTGDPTGENWVSCYPNESAPQPPHHIFCEWPTDDILGEGYIGGALAHMQIEGTSNAWFKQEGTSVTRIHLSGYVNHTTDAGNAAHVTDVGRSWLTPPTLTETSATPAVVYGYNMPQIAYLVDYADVTDTTAVTFNLDASATNPMHNLAMLINNWGTDTPTMEINGIPLPEDDNFKYGFYPSIDIRDGRTWRDVLIVWAQQQETSPATIKVYAGTAPPDTDPPTPDPMTWASVPTADDADSISMTATTATDPSGVEYYFMETSANPGGSDSGWQDPASYTDTGLNASTQYCYRVQARDKSSNQNATAWSSPDACATTDAPDTTPPTPDPMTWASVPSADSSSAISMTATTASDPSGVEYLFDETTGGGTDSGWQDSASYTDTGLSAATQYCYEVTARDKSVNQNQTAPSTNECATTDAQEPDYANSDIAVQGTVSGSYTDTQTSDNVYESITEVRQGNPRKGFSSLEHKWTINVTGGTTVTYYVEAHKTVSSDSDNFVFAYSTDDSIYTDMLTVSKTSDDDTVQSYGLPPSLSGTVYIRVVDTDSTEGNQNMDTIYIDQMYIHSETGPPDTTPPSPDPMTWASAPSADSSSAISMTATTATDDSGVEYYFDATDGGNDSGWQDSTSYTDTGLSASTQYCYRVQAHDKSPNQNATAWSSPDACATTLAGCTPTDCHVEVMVCSEQSCGGPNDNGVATVTIYDDCGDPVVGADVYGTFTGSFNEQVMDTTDGNGVAVLVSTGCLKKPTFQVCVDDVDHTLPYDSNDNLVSCCND